MAEPLEELDHFTPRLEPGVFGFEVVNSPEAHPPNYNAAARVSESSQSQLAELKRSISPYMIGREAPIEQTHLTMLYMGSLRPFFEGNDRTQVNTALKTFFDRGLEQLGGSLDLAVNRNFRLLNRRVVAVRLQPDHDLTAMHELLVRRFMKMLEESGVDDTKTWLGTHPVFSHIHKFRPHVTLLWLNATPSSQAMLTIKTRFQKFLPPRLTFEPLSWFDGTKPVKTLYD
jgi:hypothetical protein